MPKLFGFTVEFCITWGQGEKMGKFAVSSSEFNWASPGGVCVNSNLGILQCPEIVTQIDLIFCLGSLRCPEFDFPWQISTSQGESLLHVAASRNLTDMLKWSAVAFCVHTPHVLYTLKTNPLSPHVGHVESVINTTELLRIFLTFSFLGQLCIYWTCKSWTINSPIL